RYLVRASLRGAGAAVARDVPAGARDLELRLGAAIGGVRGVVRDGTGKPIASFAVVAWPKLSALGRGPATTESVFDGEGRYQLALAPGEYLVTAAARGYAPSAETRVTVPGDGSAVEAD